jgi:competence ComEA-like helix-hairpin-helix protein
MVPVDEKEISVPDISAAEAGLMNEDDALAYLASLAAKHVGEAGWLDSVVEETMGEDASAMGPKDLEFSGQPANLDEIIEPAPEDLDVTIFDKPAGEEQNVATSIGRTEPLEPGIAAAETGLMDEDEALAFLASLAAKHEGDDGWLKSVVEETMGEDSSVVEKQPADVPLASSEVTLFTAKTEAQEIEQPVPLSGEAEVSAWLDAIAENQKAKDDEPGSVERKSEPETLETTSFENTEIIAEDFEQALIDQEEIPEWLKALSEEGSENLPLAFASDIETIIKVDPNTASLSELEDIPGVGFIMAQNILDYRRTHGQIKQLEDLANVPGISEADIRGLQDFMEIPEEKVKPSLVTHPLVQPDTEVDQALYEARRNIEEQNYNQAANSYSSLIRKGQYLPEIINDLQEFLAQNPQNVNLWQALGDACLRNDQLQEAFEAYAHAEELLR